jgi:hypothetical protein
LNSAGAPRNELDNFPFGKEASQPHLDQLA